MANVRRICEVSKRQHYTSKSLLDRLGIKDSILKNIQKARLRLFEKIALVSEGSQAAVLLDAALKSKHTRVGAPRKRWADVIREQGTDSARLTDIRM